MFQIPEHVRPLRKRVFDFIEKEVVPIEKQLGSRGPVQTDPEVKRLQKMAKEQGLWALGHPKDLGGGGNGWKWRLYIQNVNTSCASAGRGFAITPVHSS